MSTEKSILDEFLEMQAQGKVVYQIDLPIDASATEAFLSPAKRASDVMFEGYDMVEIFKDGKVLDPNMRIEFDSRIVDPRANLLHLDPVVQQQVLSSIHLTRSRDQEGTAMKGAKAVELTREYLNEQVDVDQLVETHGLTMATAVVDRMKAGELDEQDSINSAQRRIIEIIAKRQEKLRSDAESYVWFTFRKDEVNDVYVGWPVSGFMPVSSAEIHRDSKVLAASSRLKRRDHIRAIKVVGPIRNYSQYFNWI